MLDCKESGLKLVCKGCEIEISKAGTKINFNLQDKKCHDVMSLKRLFEKFTEKKMEDSQLFAPLDKFNVEAFSMDITNKEISFTTVAKEEFDIIPGTGIKVCDYFELRCISCVCGRG